MKQKDFVFNICLLLFLNLLIKPFWILGIDVGVQNQVGAADYGMYFAIFSFTYMLSILLDMGTTNFNNRNISQNSQLLDKHLSSIIVLRLLLGIIYMVVVFGIALLIGYRGGQLKLLLWIAINQFLNAFLLYLRSNVAALQMFKTDSVLSILDKTLMIVFCAVLLWGNVTHQTFKIEWFIWCQTLSYCMAILVALVIVLHKSHIRRLHWNYPFFLSILKRSLPFALLSLIMVCYSRLDSVFLERLLPEDIAASQAGIYASAFRLLDALVAISYLFSVILLPLFSKMLKDNENVIPIVKTSFSFLFLFCISATVILLTCKESVISLFYNDHVAASVSVFSILLPCIIPISFTYIFGTLLTAHGNMKSLNITAAAGLLMNVLLNLILIPKMQARGAAISSLCTQSIICLIQFVLALYQLKIPFRSLPWLSCLIFLALLIPISIGIQQMLQIHVVYQLMVMAAVALLLGFASRLLTIDKFRIINVSKSIAH